MQKGGEAHYRSKLTTTQVVEIFLSDDRQVDLAERFGVTQATISAIKAAKSWKKVLVKKKG